jgi:hypothetical protein
VKIAAIDAQVPLSLLEAVRAVDQPDQGYETEYVPELRNKRLGLSDTVFAQIQRYRESARRAETIHREEVAGIARLLARRPDAETVFRAGGRHLARESYGTLLPMTRGILLTFPVLLTRPVALRHLSRLCARFLAGSVKRVGGFVYLTVGDAVAADGETSDVGCVFYEAALREYVALLVGGSGAIDLTRAGTHGGHYEWRAEWRGASPAERRALREYSSSRTLHT